MKNLYLGKTKLEAVFIFILLVFYTSLSSSPPAKNPPNIVIMIDKSGTLKHNDPKDWRINAVNVILDIMPRKSKIGIYAFDYHIKEVLPYQEFKNWMDLSIINSRLNSLKSDGMWTDIDIAVNKTIEVLKEENECNNRVLIYSDGLDDFEGTGFEYVYPIIREKGIKITTFATGDSLNTLLLKNLSETSCGNYYQPNNRDDMIAMSLSEVIDTYRELTSIKKFISKDGNRLDLRINDNYKKLSLVSDNYKALKYLYTYLLQNSNMGVYLKNHSGFGVLQMLDAARSHYIIEFPMDVKDAKFWGAAELYPEDYPYTVTVETYPLLGDIYLNGKFAGRGHFSSDLKGKSKYMISFGDLRGYETPPPRLFILEKDTEIRVEYFKHKNSEVFNFGSYSNQKKTK